MKIFAVLFLVMLATANSQIAEKSSQDQSLYIGKGLSINDICQALKDRFTNKVVKNLQEKNLLPSGALTMKSVECEKKGFLPHTYMKEHPELPHRFPLTITLENAEKVQFKIEAPLWYFYETGYVEEFEHADSIKWEQDEYSVKSNLLFPTEFILAPKCDDKNLAKQNAIAFDQETPVKLFNFILNNGTAIGYPKDLVGKKYTVSDINVFRIYVSCNSDKWTFYEMSGTLTFENGRKLKASCKGWNIFDGTVDVVVEKEIEVPQKDDSLAGRLGRLIGKPQKTTLRKVRDYEKRRITNSFWKESSFAF